MALHRLPMVLAERDPDRLRRESAVGLTLVGAAVTAFVCVGLGGAGDDPGVLAATAAMVAGLLLVLLTRVPAPRDWPLLTLVQAMVPATGSLALLHAHEALWAVMLLNAVWAALVLPTRTASAAALWNALAVVVALVAPDTATARPSVGSAVVHVAVIVLVSAFIQVRTLAMRHVRAITETASRTDVLTGLFNRRHGGEALLDETRLASRSTRPCAVLMVDVDHFKQVNDTHGHAAGDEVLVAVARRILARSRAGDVACRWGGEEFLLLARDVPSHRAMASLAEDVRASCAGAVRVTDGSTVMVTVSVGAGLSLDHPTPEELVEAADRALYEAKRAGRNCARVAGLPQRSDPAEPVRGAPAVP